MANTRLDYGGIVTTLAHYKVKYILTGSVAAAVYGVPVNPRDFDIAPELSEDNLANLALMLTKLAAKPEYIPEWEGGLTPEQIEVWRPDPASPDQLDHLMVTPYGLLDIVPKVSGEYSYLIKRAKPVQSFGTTVMVAHPDDLMDFLKLNTFKHRMRKPQLEEAKRNILLGASPVKLEVFDDGLSRRSVSEVRFGKVALLVSLALGGILIAFVTLCLVVGAAMWEPSDCLHPEPDSVIVFPDGFAGVEPQDGMTLYIPPSAANMGSTCMSSMRGDRIIELWFDMNPDEMDLFLQKSGISQPLTMPEEVLQAPWFGPPPRGGDHSGFFFVARPGCPYGSEFGCGMKIWIEGTDPQMYRVYVGFGMY